MSVSELCPFPVLVFLSLLLDTFWGGLLYRFHPVMAMGLMGRFLEKRFLALTDSPVALKILGVLLALTVPGFFMIGSAVLLFALGVNGYWFLADSLTVFWGYQLLAGRSLETHVDAVLRRLSEGDLSAARKSLSMIVGRDTGNLDQTEILRGAIESLSENATDALSAPLFYLVLGGVPLMMGYKAVSTLDSQVGYKSPPYRDLGWASARLDDLLACLPARLTLVALILLFGGSAARERGVTVRRIFSEAWKYRLAHPSPNSAHSMSAVAALVGVRIGGGASYGGVWSPKPWIGDGREDLTEKDLQKSLGIFRHFRWILLGGVGLGALLLEGLSFWKG
ncbi:MAG: adenosylcobinamide-phosphate synthase CbiB [Leptospirales bacterium]